MSSSSKPRPPVKPQYNYISPPATPTTIGCCDQGTYTEIYQPQNPYEDSNDKRKVVIYLHGFCLGPSQVYSAHIQHLVQQGYYVIYPNYQTGFCKFPDHKIASIKDLIKEALSPYPLSPQTWLNSAVNMTAQAYQTANLLQPNANVDTFLFGHSLGGLFALSWQKYIQDTAAASIQPKQIVVADPVPDSQSNIPAPIQDIIKILGGFKDKIKIQDTGKYITMPVAILHGNDDKIVPYKNWSKHFQYIKSPQKTMYLSFSDDHGSPAMYANHEQAAIDTNFISNTIANKFLNGVGTEDNLDWRYIWYALDSAIAGNQVDKLTFDMGKWSDAHDVKKIKICLPQDNVKHTRLVQSFLLAILLLAVLIAVSRLIAL